ncbi:hypothetical protein PLESTB_001113000 [Pleodorina starrii]|uniref:Uncharacterized protein n=1 Tax=Pleodorina starrii TaxID=330485 RepID=A0A9W6F5H5_9CHLO|nr:hypothetical protein PLESTM_001349900 [Pleodorina starrii]GLC56490.1 hypothetical protein PLESTB_001113000 [Pleodorina starrii]
MEWCCDADMRRARCWEQQASGGGVGRLSPVHVCGWGFAQLLAQFVARALLRRCDGNALGVPGQRAGAWCRFIGKLGYQLAGLNNVVQAGAFPELERREV